MYRSLVRYTLLMSLLGALAAMLAQNAQAQSDQRCFPETGYCISGRMREFWEQNGGLPVFGYPITPQREEIIEGRATQTQWFERNRLELHPENARPYDVLLGRLGVDRLTQQSRNWFTFPRESARQGCQYFTETGQNVCGRILETWSANGLEFDGRRGVSFGESLALFGLPISPLQTETLADGRQYQVQWFERARFELHPENARPFDVLLGLLGNEVRTGGGVTQPTPTNPTPTAPPATQVPERVDFRFPDRLTCDELDVDEVFYPGQRADSDIGTFDIPTEVPICLRGWAVGLEANIEIRKPDGNRDRRTVFPDNNGAEEWYYERLTGNVRGDYQVIITQGTIRVEGEFRVERTSESEPKVLVLPRVEEPGERFEVHVGGLRANSQVTLHLYRRCNSDQGCYVASLPSATANSDGQVEVELLTDNDDPEDAYAVGFFRDLRDADSFIYNVFELND